MILLFLAACGAGPNDETLVDEVRVMAVVVEPPEAVPGTDVTVTLAVADPAAEGATTLTWTCTDLGDGCLEAAEPGQGTTVATPVDGQVVTTRTVPAALAGVVADGETVLPLPLWALACAPDLCPVIDLASSAPAVGSADADTLSAFLADPTTGLADLPLHGTSLALGTMGISARATPVTNPILATTPTDVTAAAGAAVDLAFAVEASGATTAYGYTTSGGFDATEYPVVDGAVTLTWYAGEDAGDATLWVIVNGEDGGSAVWQGTATVE